MNGWTAALVSALLAANAAGLWWVVAWPGRAAAPWRPRLMRDVAGGTAVLVVLALVSSPVLDLLDVSPPTFRLAAATVLGLQGARWMLAPYAPLTEVPAPVEATVLVALGTALSPALVFAVMAASADAGTPAGVVAALVAGASLAAAVIIPRSIAAAPLARLVGAGALVAAVLVGVDAARTV